MTVRVLGKWDVRFMELAFQVASWSKDPSRKVGAVIADSKNRIVSVGFNGFPRGVADYPERYEDRDLKLMLVKHAEDNAIAFANLKDLQDCTLYSTLYPCSQCAGSIIRAGIKSVISPGYSPDDRFAQSFHVSATIFADAGIDHIEWIPIESGEK